MGAKYTSLILLFINISYIKGYSENVTCCPPNYYIVYKSYKCWDPSTNKTQALSLPCESPLILHSNYTVNENDQLEYKVHDLYTETFEPNMYCVGIRTTVKNPSRSRNATVLCIPEDEPAIIDDKILGYCIVVSVVFLALTAIIYSLLHELRDLQGKSYISFCASLAIGFGILSFLKLYEGWSDMTLCAARGFLAYFFVISAFFWTTAISIQVLKITRKPMATCDRGWKEYSWYALFSWGSPALLTMIVIIVNYHPGNHRRPNIGIVHCWFQNRQQQWIYMYAVMSILMAINFGIFIYAATVVWRNSFASSHIKAVRFKLAMIVRLIILMGLPWAFEMISSLTGKHIIWTILDIFNTLQGILIFLLLVVFRKRVIRAMYNHGWLNCISGPVERHLAVGDDAEENVVQHTDVPMNDRTIM